MSVLTSQQRKLLEDACVSGRRASEQAVRAALSSLAITADRPPAHLSEDDRQLRRGLRAKARQLGDTGDKLDLLIAECAYEQWHRLLFARFLAENNLLIHPEYRAPVTLEDCEELAESLDEPDGWSVAGRFAAEILPGIFRLDDPCVQLRLAPEGRLALESVVAALAPEILGADDALGWAYQYWQRERKDEVNRSERKIGGADLGPATQLFTEDYMVRFVLENSLGAWWATRHPESALIKDWKYLRLDEDGQPVAGGFDGWPNSAAEVTILDPCCGSGHFLVEAFDMLWRMRAEEEDCGPAAAQDSVLAHNLFGLELDPRCVQIAMFAVCLQAWKAGGTWRALPMPNIACSGIPVKSAIEDWLPLSEGNTNLEAALARLHVIFRDADTLGSLIDPKRAVEISDSSGLQRSLDEIEWAKISPLVESALAREQDDPATAVLGAGAVGIARAADYLSRKYTLVATNVPWVQRNRQGEKLGSFCDAMHPLAKSDLAFSFVERCLSLLDTSGICAVVTPQQWLTLSSYTRFRKWLLDRHSLRSVVQLGAAAFQTAMHPGTRSALALIGESRPGPSDITFFWDVQDALTPELKGNALSLQVPVAAVQASQAANPDARILPSPIGHGRLLEEYAVSYAGIQTGDSLRFVRNFWEIPAVVAGWELLQSNVAETVPFGGRESVVYWESGSGTLYNTVVERLGENGVKAWLRGEAAWGKVGVAVGQMYELRVTLYLGDLFDNNTAVIVPNDPENLPALWAFCSSDEFHRSVRQIDQKLGVTNKTLAKVPFDIEHWRRVAEHVDAEPWSDDMTQWPFKGRPEVATEPLQVGIARLLGYRWPEQTESDDLDALADGDGVVCVPSVRGERTASERVHELLARAFGGTWSPARTQELLADSGSKKKDLESWLRDDFFRAHCQVFKNRPFVWHVWDGRKDGFSALVNYHRLDRPTLEKLTYSYLGDWIERQVAGVRDDVAGAEERLAAARGLQQRLELILEGEPPYDIYVRWKSLAEQPIGWEPDLNDGVRLNVRPFVEAGVLRSKFNVKWEKDRGKNADGSERLNDLHYTHDEKRAARGASA